MSNVEKIRDIIGKNSSSEESQRIEKIRAILSNQEGSQSQQFLNDFGKAGIEEPGVIERSGRLVKGLGTGIGGLVDLLAIPVTGFLEDRAKLYPSKENTEFLENYKTKHLPHLRETIAKKYHELSGMPERQTGQDPLGDVIETTGEFLSPSPLTKVVNPLKGIKAATSALGKASAESVGSATALHTLPNITEEGSFGEDLAKTLIGAKAGNAAAHIPKLLPTTKNAARMAAMGSNPNTEVLDLAKKHHVDLPVNVGMNSTPLNWLSNVLSKSVFSSKKFKESLQKSNQSMLNAVKKNIDTLGVNNSEPSAAAREFNHFLSREEKEAKALVNKHYDEARNLLKPNDAVIPTHTIKTIDEMREILGRDIKSPSTHKIAGYVTQLANAWGILPKNLKLPAGFKAEDLTPVQLKVVMNAFQNNAKKIPLEKLDGVRKEIGNILGHKEEVRGMEAWLKSLRNSITQDLESSSNQTYVNKLKEANTFYKNSYANRFKEDIAESILTGSEPLYTYSKLNNVNNLALLEKVAGGSPKAKEVLDALKKTKVREVFNNAFKEEGLQVGNFARVFDKNEVNQEFLRGLVGKESYKNLREISKIAKAQIDSGKELLNTSSTAYVTSDLEKISKLGTETTAALIGLFSGNPAITLGSLGTAGARLAVPNLISRLISNPEFVKQARAFAIARKNNMKSSDKLLESLAKKANTLIKTYQYETEKEKEE